MPQLLKNMHILCGLEYISIEITHASRFAAAPYIFRATWGSSVWSTLESAVHLRQSGKLSVSGEVASKYYTRNTSTWDGADIGYLHNFLGLYRILKDILPLESPSIPFSNGKFPVKIRYNPRKLWR